jgi:hypothetical protein
MLPVFVLSLGLTAAASDDPCAQVRSVRGYAVAASLDTRTLDVLEGRLCGDGGAPRVTTSPAAADRCRDLDMMSRLVATGGGLRASDATLVTQARALACGGHVQEFERWPNGVSARAPTGAWQYPNAVTARSATGTWQYANAVTARRDNGGWQYPNAVTARTSAGRWQRPDAVGAGGPGELLAWACSRKPDRCAAVQAELDALDLHRQEAALVSFAWEAR